MSEGLFTFLLNGSVRLFALGRNAVTQLKRCWTASATSIANALHKGDPVLVDGQLASSK